MADTDAPGIVLFKDIGDIPEQARALFETGIDESGETLLLCAAAPDGSVQGAILLEIEPLGGGIIGAEKKCLFSGPRIPMPYQGKGIGSRLLGALEECALDLGCIQIQAHIRSDCPRKAGFFRQKGFAFVPQRDTYLVLKALPVH